MTKRELTRNLNFNIETSRLNKLVLTGGDLAAGCKDTKFSLFDLESGELKWQAKAYPRDELNLVQKIDVVDIKHVSEGVYYNLSAFDRIYKYDTRAQKKEISDFEVRLDPEFTTTCFDTKDHLMAVANNIGGINLFDLRNTKNILKKFFEHEGSVKDLKFHANEPKLISGEIIRIVR